MAVISVNIVVVIVVSSHVLDTLFIYLFSPVLMTDSLMTYQRHQDIEKKWTDELKVNLSVCLIQIHCH